MEPPIPPDDLLTEQRILALRLAKSEAPLVEEVHRLAELAIALDLAMSNGAPLPRMWRAPMDDDR